MTHYCRLINLSPSHRFCCLLHFCVKYSSFGERWKKSHSTIFSLKYELMIFQCKALMMFRSDVFSKERDRKSKKYTLCVGFLNVKANSLAWVTESSHFDRALFADNFYLAICNLISRIDMRTQFNWMGFSDKFWQPWILPISTKCMLGDFNQEKGRFFITSAAKFFGFYFIPREVASNKLFGSQK